MRKRAMPCSNQVTSFTRKEYRVAWNGEHRRNFEVEDMITLRLPIPVDTFGMSLIRSHGFTLLELMVVLAVASILLAVSAPNMGDFLRNNAQQAQTYELVTAIKFARSEAMKRRDRVVLCRSADPTATNPTCGGTDNTWTTGWLIFADQDTNDTYQFDIDILLRIGQRATGKLAVRTNSRCNGNLEYLGDGTLGGGTTNESDDTCRIAICDDRGAAYGRQIDVAPLGRPKLITAADRALNCTSPQP